MKIAISTTDAGLGKKACPSLKEGIFPVFGRCPAFTIVTVEGKKIKNAKIIPNPGAMAGGGAGIAAAQAVIDAGAEAVVTGNCGPNALRVLLQGGIKVYSVSGNVETAVKELLGGELQAIKSPNASSHSGRGRFRGGKL